VSGLLEKTTDAHGGIERGRRASTIRALCIAWDFRDFTVDPEMQAFGCHAVAGAPGARPAT